MKTPSIISLDTSSWIIIFEFYLKTSGYFQLIYSPLSIQITSEKYENLLQLSFSLFFYILLFLYIAMQKGETLLVYYNATLLC
jgi:hypothetical protein